MVFLDKPNEAHAVAVGGTLGVGRECLETDMSANQGSLTAIMLSEGLALHRHSYFWTFFVFL